MKTFFFSTLILQSPYRSPNLFLHLQCRGIAKVRLKWVKNRSLDHTIDTETDLKAACLLKDAINRSSTAFITVKSIVDWPKLLGLTIHVLRFIRKSARNYLRSLSEGMNLPHKFTRIFTRYPGIFYLSLKCKTTTVSLREGYQRGKLVNPHPLTCLREKFYRVMKTGLLYRGKGAALIAKEGILLNNTAEEMENGLDVVSDETGDDECLEDENSQAEESDSE